MKPYGRGEEPDRDEFDDLTIDAVYDQQAGRWRPVLAVEGSRWDDPEPESEAEREHDRPEADDA